MKRPTFVRCPGFTLAELLVSMAVFSFMTLGMVMTYRLGYKSSVQGQQKLEAMRTLRETVNRIVPIISSACPAEPPTAGGARPFAILEPLSDAHSSQLICTVPREYVDRQMKGLNDSPYLFNPLTDSTEKLVANRDNTTSPVVTFTPVADASTYKGQFQQVRFFFQLLNGPNDPTVPGGQRGNLVMDFNTPSEGGDDRVIARNLYDVDFYAIEEGSANKPPFSVVVRLTQKKFVHQRHRRNSTAATAQTTAFTSVNGDVQTYQFSNRFFLPYYTNLAGGN